MISVEWNFIGIEAGQLVIVKTKENTFFICNAMHNLPLLILFSFIFNFPNNFYTLAYVEKHFQKVKQ